MAAARVVVEAAIGEYEGTQLIAKTRSRPGPARRIAPPRRLLADPDDPSLLAVGRALGGIPRRSSAGPSGVKGWIWAIVHPADVQDRDGGILVTATLFGTFPGLKKFFADGGYQGPKFESALAKVLPDLHVEIVKRSDAALGGKVVPKRSVVDGSARLP